MSRDRASLNRKAAILSVVVALQALAVLFFVADIADDLAREPIGLHLAAEGGAVAALLAGLAFGAWQVRALIERARADEAAVAVARGAMAALMRARFAEWRLTAAEADVALFALKGCEIAEIAALRGSAEGTVRAQLTRVYAKAGVHSQAALSALFLDDLVDPRGFAADAGA